MITADELRAIVERHADELPDGRPDLMAWHPRHAQAHADRGALLDLLLRIAKSGRCANQEVVDLLCGYRPPRGGVRQKNQVLSITVGEDGSTSVVPATDEHGRVVNTTADVEALAEAVRSRSKI